MQASTLVTEDMIGEALVCGDDINAHVSAVSLFLDAGYDEVYVNQIGSNQVHLFDFYARNVLSPDSAKNGARLQRVVTVHATKPSSWPAVPTWSDHTNAHPQSGISGARW